MCEYQANFAASTRRQDGGVTKWIESEGEGGGFWGWTGESPLTSRKEGQHADVAKKNDTFGRKTAVCQTQHKHGSIQGSKLDQLCEQYSKGVLMLLCEELSDNL